MQQLDRGGAKRATDPLDSVVLGNLEGLDEVFQGLVRPQREAVQENWQNDGVEDAAPVVELESSDRVAYE